MSADAATPRWLAIVGIGEDGVEGLAPAARELVATAEMVVGGQRHLDLAAQIIQGDRRVWTSPLSESIEAIKAMRGHRVAIVASGDPFWFGIGATLAREIPAGEMIAIPAASAISLAAARLGWAVQEIDVVSLCGRPLETVRPCLQPGGRLVVLSADATTPAQVAGYLTENGFGDSKLHLMERLGGTAERIQCDQAKSFHINDISALNLMAVEVVANTGAPILPRRAGLDDDSFETDNQLTKKEIRAVTLAALAPRAGERLWDVGCGSGSVAIEWLLSDRGNTATGFEARPDRAARAARNACALGVPHLDIRTGRAPDILAGAPAPDAVFVGGGASDAGVVDTAWDAVRPGGRIVVNSVTVETDAVLIEQHRRRGGALTRLSVERLDAIGRMHGFRPAMTVTQWVAWK